MISVALGQFEHIDTDVACANVIEQCKKQLKGLAPQAGIVLCGPGFDHQKMLNTICDEFEDLELIGCTTSGEFSSVYGVSDDSICLILFHSVNTSAIGVGVGRNLQKKPEDAVNKALTMASINLSGRKSLCLAFPDLWDRDTGEYTVKALNAFLGAECPIFGGAPGTLWTETTKPKQFYNTEILTNAIPLMLFDDTIDFSFAIANSWKPVGKPITITEAEGNIIKRINDQTAVDFYQDYLGEHTEPAREFLVSVYDEESRHNYLRAPLTYHDDGAITFSDNIPTGATAQLTEAVPNILLDDSKSATEKLLIDNEDKHPLFALVFSCAFRKDILGTRAYREVEILKDNLPDNLPIIGFYTFGELAPLARNKPSILHGATQVTLLVNGREETRHSEKNLPPRLKTVEEDCRLLTKKLHRSEVYRSRLETMKDFNSTMYRRMMEEVEKTKLELQKSEEKYRRIVTTAGEGYVLMDENLNIIDMNKAFIKLSGYTEEELYQETPYDLSASSFGKFLLTQNSDSACDGYIKFESDLHAKDGRTIPTLIHGSKLLDDRGRHIGNMAFVTDLTEQKKALALAAEVQKSLLPQDSVTVPGLDIAGRNVSCDEIGGDYFDFFEPENSPTSSFGTVIGDVAGHGVDAALLMTTARAFLRMRASQSGKISDIITEMNQHLTRDVLDSGRFMTLFFLTISAQTNQLGWVRAGHDPAVLYDPETDSFEQLTGRGIALGIDEEFKYEENRKSGISPGQIIVMGTDGIWEAHNSSGEMFGKDRFNAIIKAHHHKKAHEILDAIYQAISDFTDGLKSEDDITAVVVKVGKVKE